MRIYYNIKCGVRNIFRWFPIIWYDRDWDYNYLLIVMGFKMKNMSELQRKHGTGINAQEIADDLQELSEVIDRLVGKSGYGEIHSKRIELSKKIRLETVYDEGLKMNRLIVGGLTEDERKELRRLGEIEKQLREKDYNYLFDKIKSDLRKWWD